MSTLQDKIASMATEIEAVDARLLQFVQFTEALRQNHTHFTQDEINEAEVHCASLEKECSSQRESLVSKLALYESKIVNLSNTIQIRQEIVERFEKNGAFTESDGIFNTLAQNHAKLQEEYDNAKALLES